MKYTDTHEWVKREGKVATVGITDYAQKELGDVVHVELPKVGHLLAAGDEVAVLESTKAAVDVYSPLSGTITEVNPALANEPGMINTSPEEEGWLYKVQISNPSEYEQLMEGATYLRLIES